MPNTQQTITEILDNIAMSCRMEGLEMTDERQRNFTGLPA